MTHDLRYSPPTTRLVVDRDYTLLVAEGQYEEWNSRFIGTNLFDAYPDAEGPLKPIYEEAWKVGWCYRVVAYRGLALQVHAHRDGPVVEIHATALPLDGLRETIEALLQDPEPPRALCAVIPLHQSRTATSTGRHTATAES